MLGVKINTLQEPMGIFLLQKHRHGVDGDQLMKSLSAQTNVRKSLINTPEKGSFKAQGTGNLEMLNMFLRTKQ
jgi:hypothetical protein